MFKKFIKEEKGQTMVEWILILALVAIVIIVILGSIGNKAKNKANDIDNALS